MSDIASALTSGYGRQFTAENARQVRAADEHEDDLDADAMGDEDDEMDDLVNELAALEVCYRSPEHREAIDAFLEKREPDFRAARARG